MGMTEYMMAQQKTRTLEQTVTSYQIKVANLQGQLNIAKVNGDEAAIAAVQAKLDSATTLLDEFNADLETARSEEQAALNDDKEDPSTTVKSPEATNASETDLNTLEKYEDSTRVPDPSTQYFDDGSSIRTFDDGSTLATDAQGGVTSSFSLDSIKSTISSLTRSGGIPFGAQATDKKAASAQWAGAKDLRVFLRVPQSYLAGPLVQQLAEFGGILFPYTPSISYDNQASYGSVNPVHSNFTQFFFKNSSVGTISITGKFTVQNEKEGIIWLSVQHLLRGLTKMRWGKDANAGSPPPVCRLEGYGDFMIRNVPVTVSSFKLEYPDNVDYISVNSGAFKTSMVPTVSTLSLTLNPTYSRKELQDYSVDAWLSGALKGKGYL